LSIFLETTKAQRTQRKRKKEERKKKNRKENISKKPCFFRCFDKRVFSYFFIARYKQIRTTQDLPMRGIKPGFFLSFYWE
jgi:hypothetical protein